MIPVHDKSTIEGALFDAFMYRYRRKDVALTGVLLARPENKTTQEQVLPNLDHWHWRSGDHTQFFCIGYSPVLPHHDSKPVATVAGSQWYFSAESFNEVLADIERQTKWRYRSGCYLILANARSFEQARRAYIDYSKAMVVNLGALVKSGAFESADELAEIFFEFASKLAESDAVDPIWEFSDKAGLAVLRKSLVESFLDYLPKRLQEFFARSKELAVQELHAA